MQDRSDDTHTADGVEITPGLWVWNNNLDSRQVDPVQFATEEARARLFRYADPTKTVYSEVWYEMLDGSGQPGGSIMNGTRMATVFEGFKASDHQGMSISEVRAAQRQALKDAADLHVRLILTVHVPGERDPEYVAAMVNDLLDPRFRRPLPDNVVVDVALDTRQRDTAELRRRFSPEGREATRKGAIDEIVEASEGMYGHADEDPNPVSDEEGNQS